MASTRGLYTFKHDNYRMGTLDGAFIATADAVADLMGKELYFYEVLGKHSEFTLTVDESHIKLVSDDPDLIKRLPNHWSAGHNPFHYQEDED